MLDDRKLTVLRAIVSDYVASQEPVGSKALVDRYQLGVSPATVRNDMAVLEDEGYITQPHTSAGRIPTDKGYRLFVDRLGELKPLSAAERRAIEAFMSGAVDMDDIVARTVRLLARLTHQVAIVQYPIVTATTVRHVDLIRLAGNVVMIIVINSNGRVDQHALDLSVDDEALAAMRTRLAAVMVTRSPQEAADALSGVLEQFDAEQRPAAAAVVEVLLQMLGSPPSTRVVVGGVPNLARFAREFETTVEPVLEALEEQVVLLKLLGEAAASDDVTVRIGQENKFEGLQSTSMVASAYGSHSDVWATLGIVGPTRMDYPSTMASVRAVARYVGRFLAQG
ncbi:heat-inducible transcription repressor HrcA [Raineyella antarctica]|uniref:Heat-inducible transcription repressor HrcA n=1 Tax=Raineyella antarctica TaxID=1577474 RepID=A0A1G6GXU0_9ACTN|nr:heat-inducible transcriptional repressor HrcA [Raineyella antarctica]SDB86754.1 heat-inducible transcription repressor HrcA [Raineyella antarctica]